MADMYDNNKTTCASSSSPHETDDLTLFLHQILLHRSSSSSDPLTAAAASLPGNPHPSSLLSGFGCHVTDRISTAESPSGFNSSSGAVFSSSGYYFPTNASSSVGNVEIDPDEYDGESEVLAVAFPYQCLSFRLIFFAICGCLVNYFTTKRWCWLSA